MALIGSIVIGSKFDPSGVDKGVKSALASMKRMTKEATEIGGRIKPIEVSTNISGNGPGSLTQQTAIDPKVFEHISKQIKSVGTSMRLGMMAAIPIVSAISHKLSGVSEVADHISNKIFDRKLKAYADAATNPYVKNLAQAVQLGRKLQDHLSFAGNARSRVLSMIGLGGKSKGLPSILGSFKGSRGQGGSAGGIGSASSGIGSTVGAGLGIGVGLAAVSSGLKKATTLNTEFTSAVNRSVAVLGEENRKILDSADSMSKLGVKRSDYIGAATSFASALKNTGSSAEQAGKLGNELAKVGLNLAAFADQNPEEAFTALQAALRGEFDPLERFGVFLKADTVALEAVAMGLAKSTEEVTENAKKQAAMNLILKQSADANGALGREAGETGARVRSLQGAFDNAFQKAGEAVDPIVNKLLEIGTVGFNSIAEQLTANMDSWKAWATNAASAGGVISQGLGWVGTAVGTVADSVQALTIGWKFSVAAINKGIAFWLTGLSGVSEWVEGFSKSIGVDLGSGMSDFTKAFADGMDEEASKSWQDAMDELSKPPPSDGITKYFAGITDQVDSVKKAITDTTTEMKALATQPVDKSVEKLRKKMEKDAAKLKKDVERPYETYQRQIADTFDLHKEGLIDDETRDRGFGKANADLAKAQGPFKFSAANDINSGEFRSALLSARYGSRDPDKITQQLSKDQLAVTRKMAADISSMRAKGRTFGQDDGEEL